MKTGERIKNYVLRKMGLDESYYYRKGKRQAGSRKQWPQGKKIFFLMTPAYGNLGDQAIEIATDQFLQDFFSEYQMIKVHLEDIYSDMYAIESSIKKDDIVLLQGGGNFGSLYTDIEKKRRFVISKLRDYPIVSMPSSVKYEDSRQGQSELKKSLKSFQNKKNFLIVSRDIYSYQFCREYFKDNTNYLSPDMAFYLWRKQKAVDRKSILICLRTDKEQVDQELRVKIVNEFVRGFDNAFIYDTRVEREIPDSVKKSEIDSVLNLFRCAEIVITDRLHGMIFSVITETPCVVWPSLDSKIEGTYEWIKEIESVKFLKDPTPEKIRAAVNELKKTSGRKDDGILRDNYRKLADCIRKMVDQ